MSETCFACGRKLPPRTGLKFLPDQRTIIIDGRRIVLWPRDTVYVGLMLAARGRFLSRDYLLQNVYGIDEPDSDVVPTAMYRLRRAFAGTRARIENSKAAGWRLVIDP